MAMLGVILAVVVAVVSPASAEAAPIGAEKAQVGADQAQANQLQQQIVHDGAALQGLVERYDQAVASAAAIQARIVASQGRVAADRQASVTADAHLRVLALASYMGGTAGGTLPAWFATTNLTSLAVDHEYTDLAASSLTAAVAVVEADQQRTQAAEAGLRTEETAARAAAQLLVTQRQAAQSALNQDNARLAQLHGNVQALLASIATQQQAQEAAAEQALAAKQAAAQAAQAAAAQASAAQAAAAQAAQAAAQAGQSTSGAGSSTGPGPTPVTVVHPAPGSYTNPLASVRALNPERIDQGVDYSGYGPVVALGDGTVLSTTNSGWPGGTFIAYRLSDGPAAGLVVYVAEDILPEVSVGEHVTAGMPLGTLYEGPDGMETGWADPSGDGVTMARDAGQFSGANSTAYGASFSQLLASLGAPPGILQNNPPTGQLAPGWPNF
ncbi:MAG: hypothetical protein ACP5P9_09875 [Acidimicrobiales bacterium]